MRFTFWVLFLSTISVQAISQTGDFDPYEWSPPQGCKEGKVYEGCYGSCPGGGGTGVDYLKADSKKHIAINWSTTVKGDGAPIFSNGDQIHFYDSLGGRRGTDEANFEGNAYKGYEVTENQRHGPQVGWVWVMKNMDDNIPWCSKREVYFQHPPKISASIVHQEKNGNRMEGTIKMYGFQDPTYSKNAIDGNATRYDVQRKVISRWTGKLCDVVEEYTEWENVYVNSLNNSFDFGILDCEVYYRMRNSDGVYHSLWSVSRIVNDRGSLGGGSSGGGSSSGSSSSGGSGQCGIHGCDIEP